MKVTTKIRIDLTRSDAGLKINAVQGDGNTRFVEAMLLQGGMPWVPPAGLDVSICYYQPDGHKGLYNKLADGTPAISIKCNVATIVLAAQMLTVPGLVQVFIVFNDNQLNRLTTFPFSVFVERNPVVGAQKTEDYIRLQWLEDKLDEYIKKFAGISTDKDVVQQIVDEYLDNNPPTVTERDPTVPDWAKQPIKPTYTAEEVGALPDTYTPPDQTAQQVGADPAGTAEIAVAQHNTDESAHNDFRIALRSLSERINTVLDSDDETLDQMSEMVAYIKSNKSLIDAITTSMVSVSDIINDLDTNVTDKPLSAAQGVLLKQLINALRDDKLSTDDLANAIEVALGQAKDSGSFDGKTPVKGVDYFTTEEISGIAGQAADILQLDVEQLKETVETLQSEKATRYAIKTVMDSVATPHTQYYLGNQAAVDIVLPDTANVGQIITVCWYNGETAATLSITGTMLDFDYTPSANTRSEINALWDGKYWALLGNDMAVPKEVSE